MPPPRNSESSSAPALRGRALLRASSHRPGSRSSRSVTRGSKCPEPLAPRVGVEQSKTRSRGLRATGATRSGFRRDVGASFIAELRQLRLEEAPLRVRVNELQRTNVGRARVLLTREPAQQLGAGCMQVVVGVELEAVSESQCALEVAGFRQRCGPVELDDRRASQTGEFAVELCELSPVRTLVDVQHRNRRLQHVLTAAIERQRAVERRLPCRDLRESQSVRS